MRRVLERRVGKRLGECQNQTYNRKQATEVLVNVPFILKAPKCCAVQGSTQELENHFTTSSIMR